MNPIELVMAALAAGGEFPASREAFKPNGYLPSGEQVMFTRREAHSAPVTYDDDGDPVYNGVYLGLATVANVRRPNGAVVEIEVPVYTSYGDKFNAMLLAWGLLAHAPSKLMLLEGWEETPLVGFSEDTIGVPAGYDEQKANFAGGQILSQVHGDTVYWIFYAGAGLPRPAGKRLFATSPRGDEGAKSAARRYILGHPALGCSEAEGASVERHSSGAGMDYWLSKSDHQ